MLDKLGDEINGKNIAYEYTLKPAVTINEDVSVMPIKGKANVINTALYILDLIVQNKNISNVKIILQPDIQDFINVLTKILNLLLPLSFFEKIYKIYYTSENLSSDAYESFYPNFISIDSHTAFTLSQDYGNGFYTFPIGFYKKIDQLRKKIF